MQYYNELHKSNKVLGADATDVAVGLLTFMIAMITTMYSFVITLPLFYLYLQVKKTQPRGFLIHFLYKMQIKKIKGYPDSTTIEFYQ